MIRLTISFFFIFILASCEIKNSKKITEIIDNKKDSITTIVSQKNLKKVVSQKNTKKIESNKKININSFNIKYVVGDTYYIDGVEYIPTENYDYDEIGLAIYYGKELHRKKTLNNDLNKVTELLGRHKTLPLPSIVKITNLDNGLYLTIKINDRHDENSSLIQVSRKTAQLLRFYKNKIARVRVEVLSDPSKQMKIVTQSMNEDTFNNTIDSAPIESVSISNLDNNITESKNNNYINQPIEIGLSEIENKKLYLKIYDFTSYNDAKTIISELKLQYKFSSQKEGGNYSVIMGPLNNLQANNLVLSFISKGYKKTEFILE